MSSMEGIDGYATFQKINDMHCHYLLQNFMPSNRPTTQINHMQLDNLYKMRRIACPRTCMPVTVNQSYFKETLYKSYSGFHHSR